MAENNSSGVPNAPSGAPGYDPANPANGAPGHMPPPLAPVIIPQNNNPMPTQLMSPSSAMSPGGSAAGAYGPRRAAPEPNKRALYVGGLDKRVTEEMLKQIFETTGHVVSVKIIPEKNYNNRNLNYGFVEYDDPENAGRALATLNGRHVHGEEIRVNWAYQSQNANREDTSGHTHLFVGDLSNEVNDEVLLQAFGPFGSVSEARVMWDMKTGRSRGYGFVAYRSYDDADKAKNRMNGEWLGSRAIRVNWANQKGQPSMSQGNALAQYGMTPTTPFGHHQFPPNGPDSYEFVLAQTGPTQTTVYVGNLTPYTTSTDLHPLFLNYGYVVETRMQADRGFGFVKMDTHENAANAIVHLNGYEVNGRPLKCSWGKDKPQAPQGYDQYTQSPAGMAPTPQHPFPPTPTQYYPQYGQGAPGGPMTPGGAGAPPFQAQTQGGFGGAPMAQPYQQIPQSANSYGRGAPPPPTWSQPAPPQGFAGGSYGYQG